MIDRIPTKVLDNGAIRYGVYGEDGGLLRYEYIKPEDEPTQEGTPLNKANLLSDETAALYGLDGDVIPNDMWQQIYEKTYSDEIAFSYLWSRTQYTATENRANDTGVDLVYGYESPSSVISYAESYTLNADGTFTLVSPSTVTVSYDTYTAANVIKGKYMLGNLGKLYYIPSSATVVKTSDYDPDNGSYYDVFFRTTSSPYNQLITSSVVQATLTSITSSNRNEYPNDGFVGEIKYKYLGALGLGEPKPAVAVWGSYIGTGTYGSSNPTSLTFTKKPKAVILMPFSVPVIAAQGCSSAIRAYTVSPYYRQLVTSWSGNTFSWHSTISAGEQANANGATYNYLMIF